ncbi:hypothetical protein Micbo1qcDRAFT_199965 [Microdochium bolleyi]|uniref:Uncharacterized protein n=1 Tax=Microdochium bolleyi TaxID=196109 RepID=A0A136JJC9_9PEZI|nr:hypothetical protein Micbo1qcDRAFT_199965 [Microdochium bolleyi]
MVTTTAPGTFGPHRPLSEVDRPASPARALIFPDNLEDSPDVLEYVGFTPERAAELWAAWVAFTYRQAGSASKPFITWVLGQLGDFRGDDTVQNHGEWRLHMSEAGLSLDFQDCVLEPYFESIRKRETCTYWVVANIEGRYANVQSLKAAREAADDYFMMQVPGILRVQIVPTSGSGAAQDPDGPLPARVDHDSELPTSRSSEPAAPAKLQPKPEPAVVPDHHHHHRDNPQATVEPSSVLGTAATLHETDLVGKRAPSLLSHRPRDSQL